MSYNVKEGLKKTFTQSELTFDLKKNSALSKA